MPTARPWLRHRDPLAREVASEYARGRFLMNNGRGLRWYEVERRALVPLGAALHVSRRFRRELPHFSLSVNTAFQQVLDGCRDREETWIDDELAGLYIHLHRCGLVHSFESWRTDAGGDGEGRRRLAGGVLGLVLGGAFIGETMFSAVTGGSKAALVGLSRTLAGGGFTLLDAQIQNPHLARFGTYEVSGREYRARLSEALETDAALPPDGFLPGSAAGGAEVAALEGAAPLYPDPHE